MRARIIWTLAGVTLTGAFALLLLGPVLRTEVAPDWLRALAGEVVAVCRDPGTQWMVVVCLVSYFVMLLVLERKSGTGGLEARSRHAASGIRHAFKNSDFWLLALGALVLIRYFVGYESAAQSVRVVILLTGIVFGKAVACLTRKRTATVPLWILLLLLAGVALWQPEYGTEFQYRGARRWTGPWDNPNLFGLLMGVGTILALGLLVQSRGNADRPAFNSQLSTLSFCHRFMLRVTCHLPPVLLLAVAAVCAFGLLKSYSRGAWLGTTVGLGFLIWNFLDHKNSEPNSGNSLSPVWGILRFIRLNWRPSGILLVSIFVISFWQFRHTEVPLLRRVFSVGNVNDFSWRNRVTTWTGAMKMIKDRPLVGHGWGRAEVLYNEKYKPERLADSGALGLNDYLTIVLSCGIPATAFLVIYLARVLWRVLKPRFENTCETATTAASNCRQMRAVSAAGALLLAVGFWFDGGLFKLPISIVFWVLLEQARVETEIAKDVNASVAENVAFPSAAPVLAPTQVGGKRGRGMALLAIALRSLAGIAGIAAMGLTVLHLGVPQLSVGDRALNIARRYLIQSKEQADFEFLASRPIWSGQKLTTLLTHVQLANYTRQLVNWQLDTEMYQWYVLSPDIHPAMDGNKDWRRELWEYFYPRVRQVEDVSFAAETVARQLEERMKRGTVFSSREPRPITDLWRNKDQPITPAEFEALAVAAFRAAGILSRLNDSGKAEFWDGQRWKPVFVAH